MTFLIVFLVVVILALAVSGMFLFLSIKRNIELTERLEVLGEQVDESLDILDTCYNRISKTLAIPLASDDPEVRSVLSSISDCHDAVLQVANKLVEFDELDENNE